MPFTIFVFNSIPLGPINPHEILAAITASNYYTLCGQYGLNPALISPGLARLGVLAAPAAEAPFFTVVYRQDGERPVVVTIRDWDGASSVVLPPISLQDAIANAVQVVSIELAEDQLWDLGLLLAYEVARWAAVQGKGVVQALDGHWYRLNEHQSFLPVGE